MAVSLHISPPVSGALHPARFPDPRTARKSPPKLLCTRPNTTFAHKITNSWQPDFPLFIPLNESIAAIIFGDGSESQLYPLTKRRSDGAVPVAANYRIIDVVVSNCINSNITKIYALTQFNSTSLNSHISRAYSRLNSRLGFEEEGFVEVLAAYQSPEVHDWYQGNADAVRKCLWVLEEQPVMEFLILPGYHLYRMDYSKLIETHRASNADITVATSMLNANQVERPKKLKETYHDIGSMGIYVIDRDVMIKLLTEYFPKANDFGSEVIPGAISMGLKVERYRFDGYWEDMGSIQDFYLANMELTKKRAARFSLYDRDNPIYTLPRHLPPSWISDTEIVDCVIGEGCIFKSCKIQGSVIGMRACIGDGVVIEDSVVMGADIYETRNVHRCMTEKHGNIPIGIGDQSLIRKAIIDKNARIGKNVKIMNVDNVQEGSRESDKYLICGGIVVVLRGSVIPDGSIL